MQRTLEHTYEVASPWRVGDFVLSDPALRERLHDSPRSRPPEEELLVHHEADAVELSLWLSPGLRRRLSAPRVNAADFTMALEGVSHFLCVAWNASHARAVTPLELELQAEVDKLLGLMAFQGEPPQQPRHLHRWLYEEGVLDPALAHHERDRYRLANHLAGRYWRSLLQAHPSGTDDPRLARELRRFYRLPRESKLRRIDAL